MKKSIVKDQRVLTIINDPLLPGKEKCRRIGVLLKSRKQIQIQTSLVEAERAHKLKSAWIPDGFDPNGIELYLGVKYCVNCHLAHIVVRSTTHIDEKPIIRRSDIRLTPIVTSNPCGPENGDD